MTDWTPEIAFARLVEAADTEWRMPRARLGPGTASGFWPGYIHDLADQNGWGGERYREERARFYAGRDKPTAAELSRWEEVVFDWRKITPDGDGLLLRNYVRCILTGASFSEWCVRNRFSRGTAYRRLKRGLERLAARLCRECVFLRPPNYERVRQLVDPRVAKSLGLDDPRLQAMAA